MRTAYILIIAKFGELLKMAPNRWKSTKCVMVSTSLIDKQIGLEELGEGIWRIYYRQKMLGCFDS